MPILTHNHNLAALYSNADIRMVRMIFPNEFQAHNRENETPSNKEIDNAFIEGFDPRRRLLNALDDAEQNNKPIVCDIEMHGGTVKGAIAWRNAVVYFFTKLEEHPKYWHIQRIMWGMPYSNPYIFTHEKRIKEGINRSIKKIENIKIMRANYTSMLQQINRGPTNKIGIEDVTHTLAPVCYESLNGPTKWPDTPERWHLFEDWIPQLMKMAEDSGKPFIPWVWHMTQDHGNKSNVIPASPEQATILCDIFQNLNIKKIGIWSNSGDTFSDPQAVETLNIYINRFGKLK